MFFDLGAMVAALGNWGDMLVGCCFSDGAISDRTTKGAATDSSDDKGEHGNKELEHGQAKVVKRGVFIFTDIKKALETIPEEREEDVLCVEVKALIPTAPTSPATSPSSPDTQEEQYGAEVQSATKTPAATEVPALTVRKGRKARKGDLQQLIEDVRRDNDKSNRRNGGRTRRNRGGGSRTDDRRSRGRDRRRDSIGPDSPLCPRPCMGQ